MGRLSQILLIPGMGAQEVTPLTIFGSGLAAWYKSDAGTFQAAAGAAAVADTDPVGQWQDQSGNSRHMSQSTAGSKPLLKLNIKAGKPAIRFDGTDDALLSSTAFLSGTAGRWFAVVQYTATIKNDQIVIATADAATNTRSIMAVGHRSANQNPSIRQVNGDTADLVRGSGAASAGVVYLVEWGSDGAAYDLAINASSQSLTVVTGANTGDWAGDTTALDNVSLGASQALTPSDFMKGDIFEVILADGAVTAGQTTAMRSYLNSRWSIY